MIYANHDQDHAGAGEPPCSITSRAARASFRCTAHRTASSIPRSTSTSSAAQFQSARHRHVPHRRSPEPIHPIMKGFERLRELGRNLRPHQAQREGPHRPGISRRQGARRSRGPGCARTARGASSTPPGATTNAPGAIPAFKTCVERGIRWAVGRRPRGARAGIRDRPEMTAMRKDVKPFEYKEAKIPFYPPKPTAAHDGPSTQDAEAARSGRVDEALRPSGRFRAEAVRRRSRRSAARSA